MTNLKDKWEAAFAQFPHKDDILKDIRQEALRFFASNGFPHKNIEAWKYTSLEGVQATDYTLWQPTHAKKTPAISWSLSMASLALRCPIPLWPTLP